MRRCGSWCRRRLCRKGDYRCVLGGRASAAEHCDPVESVSGRGAELLAKLLRDKIRTVTTRNVAMGRRFNEMLTNTLNAYHNRAIATQEVIEELIRVGKQVHAAMRRGEELGLNDPEVAFYDALAENDTAVQVMGVPELKAIATELVTQVCRSVTIDWTLRESAPAKIRVMVKRILKKHKYPPDLQDKAVQTVLAQAEALCAEVTEG